MIILGADKELAIFCPGEESTTSTRTSWSGSSGGGSYSGGYYRNGTWVPYSGGGNTMGFQGSHHRSSWSSGSTYGSSARYSQLVIDKIDGILKEGAEEEAAKALELLEAGEGDNATDEAWNQQYYAGGEAGGADGGWVFDTFRKWLPANGGCFYIDMGHLEMALPETSTPGRYLASHEAMLEMVRDALRKTNEEREKPIHMGVFNSDMHGNSWGGHDNYGISSACWRNLMGNNLWMVCAIASFQASMPLLCGQGKVGVEENMPDAVEGFQMSTRADYLHELSSVQTTYKRPLLNTRNEPHGDTARLHVIFYDQTLMPYSTYLRVGAMSLFLAMMERRYPMPQILLDRPLVAAQMYSRDTTFEWKMRSATGHYMNMIDMQEAFCEKAEKFVEHGYHDGLVDDESAKRTLRMWRETLDAFRQPDWLDKNSPRLDWVMKLRVLRGATESMGREWMPDALNELANYSFDATEEDPTVEEAMKWAAQMRKLDMQFHSLGDDSLFSRLRKSGRIEEVLPASAIRDWGANPDPATRAWPRAMLLRKAHEEGIRPTVDWEDLSGSGLKVEFPSPWINPANYEPAIAEAGSFKEAMVNLGAEESFISRTVSTVGRAISTVTGGKGKGKGKDVKPPQSPTIKKVKKPSQKSTKTKE